MSCFSFPKKKKRKSASIPQNRNVFTLILIPPLCCRLSSLLPRLDIWGRGIFFYSALLFSTFGFFVARISRAFLFVSRASFFCRWKGGIARLETLIFFGIMQACLRYVRPPPFYLRPRLLISYRRRHSRPLDFSKTLLRHQNTSVGAQTYFTVFREFLFGFRDIIRIVSRHWDGAQLTGPYPLQLRWVYECYVLFDVSIDWCKKNAKWGHIG